MTNKFTRAGGYALLIPPGIACGVISLVTGAGITNKISMSDYKAFYTPAIIMTYVVSGAFALAPPAMLVYTLITN